jgi:hypothetical protein
MTTAEGDRAPSRFDAAARALARGELPPWLVAVLERFGPFIAGRATDDGGDEEKRMLDAARYLEKWLPMYVGLEEVAWASEAVVNGIVAALWVVLFCAGPCILLRVGLALRR